MVIDHVIGGASVRERVNEDVVSGALFVVIGIVVLLLARDFPMGAAMQMGPGYLPTVLSWILAGTGIALKGAIVGGLRIEPFTIKPVLFVLLALFAFALLIERVGLAPAVFITVLVGAYGGHEFRVSEALILALGLTMACVGIFIYALGLPIASMR